MFFLYPKISLFLFEYNTIKKQAITSNKVVMAQWELKTTYGFKAHLNVDEDAFITSAITTAGECARQHFILKTKNSYPNSSVPFMFWLMPKIFR